MHSRESSRACVENETIVVSTRGRGSHDCARHATIHGGADGREDSRSPCGSQSMYAAPGLVVDVILEAAQETLTS